MRRPARVDHARCLLVPSRVAVATRFRSGERIPPRFFALRTGIGKE